jgi:hypothetical protein
MTGRSNARSTPAWSRSLSIETSSATLLPSILKLQQLPSSSALTKDVTEHLAADSAVSHERILSLATSELTTTNLEADRVETLSISHFE